MSTAVEPSAASNPRRKGTRKPWGWKIVDGVYLSGRSTQPDERTMNETQAKFVRLFRETWQRIPLGDRRLMRKHWRTPIDGVVMADSPEIYVEGWWPERDPGDLGRCGQRGHALSFWTPVIRMWPDENIRELIAHELAHVVQNADSDKPLVSTHEHRIFDDVESDADNIMDMWGFDPYAIDDLPTLPEDPDDFDEHPEDFEAWELRTAHREHYAA